jgi:hypothetical protein
MPRGPKKGKDMEKPKRARMRKPDTSQGGHEAISLQFSGGRGEVESEGHEEKYRAVIKGGYPDDELVGRRWAKVEPALRGLRRSHSPTAPRCVQIARYGRTMRDSGALAGSPVGE